jgi:sugar phosphate isomerase/epimerase
MKYAICNETFESWDHERICRFVSSLGYEGLEIAPFTIVSRISDLAPKDRGLLRRQASDCGLKIIGLHWLLARTGGLHLTSPDAIVRERTAEYLAELARCCRDLGGHILVFGSPAQRRVPVGVSKAAALDYAADTFGRVLPVLAECGVFLCLEPLSPEETDFINTCSEAAALLDRLAHPNLCLHLDVKAMSSEKTAVSQLIQKYASRTGHFHANDPNKRGPGFGAVDFVPIMTALQKSDYRGWVSVEVFDYSPDPETIARESIRYLRECDAKAIGERGVLTP